MKIDFVSKHEKILYYFISFTVIIDAINGVLTNQGVPGFGQYVRVVALLYFLYIIIKFNIKSFIHISVIICFFGINALISYYFFHNKIYGLGYDLKYITRIIFYISFVVVFRILYEKKLFRKEILERGIFNNIYILPVIMILSYIFNLGRSTYKNAGFIGPFISNNATSITMIVLLIFTIKKLEERTGNRYINIIYVFLMSIVIFMQGSKSSFLFLGITFLYFITRNIKKGELKRSIEMITVSNTINYFKEFNFKNYKNKLKIIYPLLIIIVSVVLILIFFDQIKGVFSRQVYFLYNKDLITYIMSDRNIFLVSAFKNYFDNFDIFRTFFGIGNYFSNGETARYISMVYANYSNKSIEMDIFDLFFSYGILGVLFTYGFSIRYFVKNIDKNKLKCINNYIFCIIIVFSILAGHVFGDVLSSSFLAYVLGLIIMSNGDKIKDEQKI